ncbi:MAG: transporter [Saprospiraceae bacterium]|nr:transporter [Lewinella sp.]
MKNIFLLALLSLISLQAMAQLDGARVYWALPKNMNIVSAHLISGKANASLNNMSFVNPSVTVDNNLYMLTYTRSQPLFGRTFYSTLVVPAADITATVNLDPQGPATSSSTLFQHGLGDIVWSNTINLIGAPGLMIKDYVRHESPTLVYLQAAATFPTGQYDASNPVNIGSNQFKVKLGMPVVQRIGPAVDGQRMALEIFPAYTFIGRNDDLQGQEVAQSGVFTLETHLSKDITKEAFLSLDYSYINGGSSDFISKESGSVVKTQPGQKANLVGATLGYRINDYLNLFLTHNQTFSSGNDNVSLEGTVTKITLSWSFHDFQEKFRSYINSN